VILAAGASTRLGRPKQLLELGGMPVIRLVSEAALRAALDDVVVVLGHDAEAVRAALADAGPRVRTVLNDRYREGQSTSLVAGIRAMRQEAEAALVLLGDQPEVRVDAIDTVLARWRTDGGDIVQAAYGGTAAHPMLFDRSMWPELEGATGDEGARGIIARHRDRRILVEVGGRPPRDIDTAEDYERIKASFRSGTGRPAH
jgi:molybdenum cofactor cytidylyltransferase